MANNKNIRKSKNGFDGNLENSGSINSVIFGLFFIAVKIITLLEIFFCGPKGTRTPDLSHAMGTRYQLRYGPKLLKYLIF